MATKKSKTQLEAELKVLRSVKTSEGITHVLLALIRWGGILGIARYAYLSIRALAGKNTGADIGVQFFANIDVSIAIAWGVAGGCILYGARQRKLRKDTVERLMGRIQTLEGQLDPNRTSSKLTLRGDTRPEDKP